jgi:hypothetical protein
MLQLPPRVYDVSVIPDNDTFALLNTMLWPDLRREGRPDFRGQLHHSWKGGRASELEVIRHSPQCNMACARLSKRQLYLSELREAWRDITCRSRAAIRKLSGASLRGIERPHPLRAVSPQNAHRGGGVKTEPGLPWVALQ